MSTEPQKGDRVRVTYEAEYVRPRLGGGHYLAFGDFPMAVPSDAVIEVLPKKPIKVGDEIAPERVAELPEFSVILSSGLVPFIVRCDKRITGASGGIYDPREDHTPLTVLHIPD